MKPKRRCLVCRMGTDAQKVEPLEILAGLSQQSPWPPQTKQEGMRVRVPLCNKHKDARLELLAVWTGEGDP